MSEIIKENSRMISLGSVAWLSSPVRDTSGIGENRLGAFLMRTLRYKETLNSAVQYQESWGNEKKTTHLYDFMPLYNKSGHCAWARARVCVCARCFASVRRRARALSVCIRPRGEDEMRGNTLWKMIAVAAHGRKELSSTNKLLWRDVLAVIYFTNITH